MTAETLVGLFDYDRWANRQWADRLPAGGQDVVWHIEDCHFGWLSACQRTLGETPVATRELEALADEWQNALVRVGPETRLEPDGFSGTFRFGDIARHVLFHGTYHRGQLRALAEGSDFPETDLSRYLSTVRRGPAFPTRPRPALLREVRYDRWGNAQWLPLLATHLQADAVMRHIAWAQLIWCARVEARDPNLVDGEPTPALVARASAELEAMAQQQEPGRDVTFQRSEGEVYTRRVDEILSHVVNHGAYHRGQIRQIVPSGGDPETDFDVWLCENEP